MVSDTLSRRGKDIHTYNTYSDLIGIYGHILINTLANTTMYVRDSMRPSNEEWRKHEVREGRTGDNEDQYDGVCIQSQLTGRTHPSILYQPGCVAMV